MNEASKPAAARGIGDLVPGRCISGSMQPAIREGERVLIDTRARSVAPGGVLCFRQPGATGDDLVMHRVIGRFELGGETYHVETPEQGRRGHVVEPTWVVGRVVRLTSTAQPLRDDYVRALSATEHLAARRAWLRWLLGRARRRLSALV